MGKNAKKTSKGSRTKKAAVKDLPVKDAKAVQGGRKAGGGQQDYLQVTLDNATISSINF